VWSLHGDRAAVRASHEILVGLPHRGIPDGTMPTNWYGSRMNSLASMAPPASPGFPWL
jgi:hypothetical protein